MCCTRSLDIHSYTPTRSDPNGSLAGLRQQGPPPIRGLPGNLARTTTKAFLQYEMTTQSLFALLFILPNTKIGSFSHVNLVILLNLLELQITFHQSYLSYKLSFNLPLTENTEVADYHTPFSPTLYLPGGGVPAGGVPWRVRRTEGVSGQIRG